MSTKPPRTFSNLPDYLTRFIGRKREIAKLKQIFTADRPVRLVSLTGVGGCGKTRLAAELSHALIKHGESENKPLFEDGVYWINLSSLSDVALLPLTVAAGLNLREAKGRSPTTALLTVLRNARTLLVWDNCDHLVGACGELAESLLAGCPHLVILVTSCAPLNVPAESIFPVPPLAMVGIDTGAPDAYQAPDEAARLFLDRAAMVLSGYTIHARNIHTINQICRRLDGLPLAIELAASWIRVLSVRDILMQVEQNLDFLTSSEPTLAARHRSMRAVLNTSWQRLTEEQQHVLAALAVFRGSFSREAAEVGAGASLPCLAALVENSLIQRLPGGEGSTRYQLHEVVRQYALDRLEAYADDSSERAQQRHLAFFLDLAEQAAQTWDTAKETAWLRQLQVEQENLRVAVRRAIEQGKGEYALRLSAALFTFWVYTTPLDDYRKLLQYSLSIPWDNESSVVTLARAKALNVAGYAAVAATDYTQALACFQDGLALYSRLGDERGISWSLRGCGFATLLGGQVEEAKPFVEQSLDLSRRCNDAWGEAWAIFDLGHIAFAQDAIERAQPLLEAALERFRIIGILFGTYRALILLGDIQRRHSRWGEALAHYDEALRLEQENRFGQFGADLLEGLGKYAAIQRQPRFTVRLFGAGYAWRQTFGQARSFFYEPGYQRILAITHRQLAEDDWSINFTAGCGLTSELAMAEACHVARALASDPLAPNPAGLTEREVEVLHLLVAGLKDQEIADRLVVSPRTVHAHLRSIYGKLGVNTRTAAVYEAAQLNLV